MTSRRGPATPEEQSGKPEGAPAQGAPTTYSWNPLLVIETGDHEMRVRRGDSVTVLKEPSGSVALSRMAELGWLDAPAFTANSRDMSDEMEHILEGLIQNDILRPHTGLDTIPPVVAEYCARSGYQVEEAEATRRLHSTKVIVSGDNTSLADLLIAELRSLGITVDTLDTFDAKEFDAKEGQDFTQMPTTAAEKGQESVAVSVHHDILSEASLRQNRLLVEQQFPGRILFVGGFDGKRSVIGPWVVPGSSACLRCWAYRYHANLISVPESVRPGAPKSPWHLHHRPRAPLPAANRLITALASDLIAEYVTLGPHAPSSQPGTYRVIESSRNGTVLDRHHVLRVPRCDVCSQSRTTGYPQVWHHG